MKYLLLGGAPGTGKTSAIHRLANLLTTPHLFPFTILSGSISTAITPSGSPHDFRVLLEGPNASGITTRIIINSATDDKYNIDELKSFYEDHIPVDIIISSVRDIYWERSYLFTTMGITSKDFVLELPLAKITRRNDFPLAITWFENSIQNLALHILQAPPFNI